MTSPWGDSWGGAWGTSWDGAKVAKRAIGGGFRHKRKDLENRERGFSRKYFEELQAAEARIEEDDDEEALLLLLMS